MEAQGIKVMGIALGVKERALERAESIERLTNAIKKNRQEASVQDAKGVLFVVQPQPLIVAGPGTFFLLSSRMP